MCVCYEVLRFVTQTPEKLHITGMNKMVINHLEKLFVTNDAATILRELEVCGLCYFPESSVPKILPLISARVSIASLC